MAAQGRSRHPWAALRRGADWARVATLGMGVYQEQGSETGWFRMT